MYICKMFEATGFCRKHTLFCVGVGLFVSFLIVLIQFTHFVMSFPLQIGLFRRATDFPVVILLLCEHFSFIFHKVCSSATQILILPNGSIVYVQYSCIYVSAFGKWNWNFCSLAEYNELCWCKYLASSNPSSTFQQRHKFKAYVKHKYSLLPVGSIATQVTYNHFICHKLVNCFIHY